MQASKNTYHSPRTNTRELRRSVWQLSHWLLVLSLLGQNVLSGLPVAQAAAPQVGPAQPSEMVAGLRPERVQLAEPEGLRSERVQPAEPEGQVTPRVTEVATEVTPTVTPAGPTATPTEITPSPTATSEPTLISERPTATPVATEVGLTETEPTPTPSPEPTGTPSVISLLDLIPEGMSVTTATVAVDGVEAVTLSEGAALFMDGRLAVMAEPGAWASPVTLRLTAHTEAETFDPLWAMTNSVRLTHFTLEAVDASTGLTVTHFAQPVRLALDLRDLATITTTNWYLAYQDELTLTDWHKVGVYVHAEQGLISTLTDHFSSWAAGTEPGGWQYQWRPPTVNQFSGAATYQYPIPVPPGRAGLTPNLDATYSTRGIDMALGSGQDQGPLGLGWSIGSFEVTRDDVFSYNDSNTNYVYPDKFSLALNGGSYNLVPGGNYYLRQTGNGVNWDAALARSTHQSGSYSIVVWFRVDNAATAITKVFVDNTTTTGTPGAVRQGVAVQNGNLYFERVWNEGATTHSEYGSPVSVTANVWYRVEFTLNGSSITSWDSGTSGGHTYPYGSVTSDFDWGLRVTTQTGNTDVNGYREGDDQTNDLLEPFSALNTTHWNYNNTLSHTIGFEQNSPFTDDWVQRYYAENGPGLYVERRYEPTNTDATLHADKVYWAVKTGNGTTYRLGYTSDAATNQDPHEGVVSFDQGLLGSVVRSIGLRWRVDTVTDISGNQIQYRYDTWINNSGTVNTGMRRLAELRYNFEVTTTNPLSQVISNTAASIVKLVDTSAGNNLSQTNKIDLYHVDLVNPYRTITFALDNSLQHKIGGSSGECESTTQRVLSITEQISGGPSLPATVFGYQVLAHENTDCYPFSYLAQVWNGYGARMDFFYQSDGRQADDRFGHSYVVTQTRTWDSVNGLPAVVSYTYAIPCYDDPNASVSDLGWFVGAFACPLGVPIRSVGTWTPYVGPLVGFKIVTVTALAFDGTPAATSATWFHQDADRSGRSYLGQTLDPVTQAVLQQSDSAYMTVTMTNTTFSYLGAVTSTAFYSGGHSLSRRTEYDYATANQGGAQYGNQTHTREYDENGALYRQTVLTYYPNADTSKWLVNHVAVQDVWDAQGNVLSRQRNHYSNSTVGNYNQPPQFRGLLTTARVWMGPAVGSGDSWQDVTYSYDLWGNQTKQTEYQGYGTDSAFASDSPRSVTTTFDSTYNLYPVQMENAKGYTSTIGYSLTHGLPLTMTDINGNATTFRYDVFGRLLKVIRPGDSEGAPTVQYAYADPAYPVLPLRNSDFETANVTWGEYDPANHLDFGYTTAEARSGAQSLFMTLSSNGTPYPWVGANVEGVQSHQSYQLQAYVKSASSVSFCMHASSGTAAHTGACVTTSSTWQLLTATVNFTEATQLLVYFTTTGNGTFYVDDVRVGPLLEINTTTKQDATNTLWSRQVYDGLGRALQTQTEKDGTLATLATQSYDALGRTVQQWLPYEALGATGLVAVPTNQPRTTTLYDAVGQAVKTTAPDGASSSSISSYGTQLTEDPNGHIRLAFQDGFGRVTAVNELLATWSDDFANGVFASEWFSSGTVAEGGGVAYITDTAYLSNTLGTSPADHTALGVVFSFYIPATTTQSAFYLRAGGAFSDTTYRRWGLLTNGGVLYRETYLGATQTTVPMLTLKANTWYRAVIKAGSASQAFVVTVWERDNPGISAVRRELLSSDWHDKSWNYVAQVTANGNAARLDNYAEVTYYTTRYLYNVRDQLIRVTDTLTVSTIISYNFSGQKIGMTDPDMGTWTYGYNAIGQMITQTDARGCTITFAYTDTLGRLTGKNYSGGGCGATTTPVVYEYDAGVNGKGQRTQMFDGIGWSAWQYDVRGQVVSTTLYVDGVGTYLTRYGYNNAGQVVSMTYPAGSNALGETVLYTYTAVGQPYSIAGTAAYLQDAAYDATGRPLTFTFNSVLSTTYGYYPWTQQGGRLQQLKTWGSSGTTLQQLLYAYDNVGNVQTITTTHSPTETRAFTYDSLDRLTQADLITPTLTSESYTYDPVGRLLSLGGNNYTYDTTHKHAVASIASGPTFGYDENGNVTSRDLGHHDPALTYDAENRLVSVLDNQAPIVASAVFTYNGDGQRVQATIDGVTTVYIGNYYEFTSDNTLSRTYYYMGAQRLAVRERTVQGKTVTNNLYFLQGDHLGSTSIVATSGGALYSELRYEPWGETRYSSGTTPTDFRYTGQKQTTSGGSMDWLYYYNARWYDPTIGRFLQADTIVPGPTNPQAFNRYSYVSNNPVNYTDPSGHICVSDDGSGNEYTTSGDCAGTNTPKQNWNYTPKFDEDWTKDQQAAALSAIYAIAVAMANATPEVDTPEEVFRSAFGTLMFFFSDDVAQGGCVGVNGGVKCNASADITSRFIAHELGHSLAQRIIANEIQNAPEVSLEEAYAVGVANSPYGDIKRASIVNDNGILVAGIQNGEFKRTMLGYAGEGIPDVYHGKKEWADWDSNALNVAAHEDFADMFLNWTYNSFDYGPTAYGAGSARYDWMAANMNTWLTRAYNK